MLVELRDIHKHFGSVKANDGISMSLEGGRIYGLLGENGAGKSTLMKILSGYQPPDSGTVLLDDEAVRFSSPADALDAGVGMLYQDPHDFPPFNVVDNYMLGRESGVVLKRKEAESELRALADRYSFEVDVTAYVDTLSVGERQQLELIRLLAGGAEVLILDEPTTGISAEQKELLFESMLRLAHEEGKTLLLVSHKLAEVQELCDYAFVLRRGQLVGETAIPCPTEHLVQMMFEQVPRRKTRPAYTVGNTCLEINDLTIRTYRLDVEDVSLTVRKGEIFGLAGLEGSGQGLLLQAVAGLLKPEQGTIFLDGIDVTSFGYHEMQRAGAAYLAAGRLEEGLVAGLTLTEHVILSRPKQPFVIDWPVSQAETSERISRYEVVGSPESTADQLSGGNQQRFLFALLNTPLKLLLLEQPTRGLDVRSADYVWDQLYQRRVDGTSILFISADLDEIIDRSDRIAVFFNGTMSRTLDARSTSVEELGHLIGGHS